MEAVDQKIVPLNAPQMLYNIVMPKVASVVWGRFGGKTEGPGASFTTNNMEMMPGSNGFVQGVTYEQLLTMTLPGLIAGWEKLEYEEDKHFWIRKFPPDKLLLNKPLRRPRTPEHYISFWNGSGIYMVSQDRSSTIHGVRTQWGFVDEAKKINKKKFDEETIPTMAGGNDLWGSKAAVHRAEYLSLLFCSDMPTTSDSRWLLDFEKLMEKDRVQLIMEIHVEITRLKSEDPFNHKRIAYLEGEYNDLRRECVYFSEASALDNIEFVGLGPIEQAKLVLSDIQFRVSILNERLLKNEKGFYPLLDPKIHGYDNINYSYVDTLSFDFRHKPVKDCRWDGDVVQDQPLHVALDHNNIINCIATRQVSPTETRLLSTMHVEHPLMLKACLLKWNHYYKYHRVKELHYWFDATSIGGGKNANSNVNFSMEVISVLTDLGWTVIPHNIGQIGSHTSRFHFFGLLFTGNDPRLPRFTYNKTNCATWEFAAQQAGLIRKGDEYIKDKSSEKKPNIPPIEATHMTEAVDILLYGAYKSVFRKTEKYVGITTS